MQCLMSLSNPGKIRSKVCTHTLPLRNNNIMFPWYRRAKNQEVRGRESLCLNHKLRGTSGSIYELLKEHQNSLCVPDLGMVPHTTACPIDSHTQL